MDTKPVESWARDFKRRFAACTASMVIAAKSSNPEMLDALRPTAAQLARDFDALLCVVAAVARNDADARAKVAANG